VARDWNGRGLLTPQSKRDGSPSRWTTQTVRPTLLNPRYAGLRGGPIVNVENKRIKAHRQIMGVATWPALVPESTWRAVHALLTDAGRANPPRSGRALLTGVAVCGVCGALVHVGASPARRGNPSQRNYRCSGSLGHVGRRAEPVEQYVSELVLERLSRDDASDLLIDHDRADVDELRGELLTLRNRRRSLLSLIVDGTFSESEVRIRAAALDEQIGAVEGKLADAGRVNVIGPLLAAEDLRAAWEAYGTDRQRAVIDCLLYVRIHPAGRGTRTFRPESVGIEWKF
jgi:site-specific DNA recombinase